MLPVQPNQSLMDGLACLQALAVQERPVGGRELARMLGMDPTRVHRLLKTLAHLGIARQTPESKYEPGPGMQVLAAQSLFASGLIRRAMEPLASLHRHNRVVAMGVLWKQHVCYLYHALPGMTQGQALGRVALYPATQSSIGMILLAFRPADEVRELYQSCEIPGYGTSLTRLLADLKRFRREGYATVTESERPVKITMAVPLGADPYAAIALSGPMTRDDIPRLLASLREVAERIEPRTSKE